MDGRTKLERAFKQHGLLGKILESHLEGCSLIHPVEEMTLPPGTRLDVWVVVRPGKFAAPHGEDPTTLGIIMEDRHLEVYEVREAFSVVACKVAPFAVGLVENVGGMGGGTQYVLPPDWLSKVERIQ